MKEPFFYNDNDDEVKLPWKWEICDACDGHGTSSAYLGAFTRDDLYDMGDEWCEDYFAGRFDRACEHCSGGKVKVVDESRCSKEDLDKYYEQQQIDADIDHMQKQEMLMEGGWREMGWYD